MPYSLGLSWDRWSLEIHSYVVRKYQILGNQYITTNKMTICLISHKLQGRLQIFGTMHKKMQISLKWLKYRLKILKSSFIYYFYIVPVVPKLKKLKKSPYDQNNRNWMSHWHHANYHIFCNFHWKFGTQPLKPFISIST